MHAVDEACLSPASAMAELVWDTCMGLHAHSHPTPAPLGKQPATVCLLTCRFDMTI